MYFAESTDELPDPATVRSMSGLEFMQRVRDGTLPQPPIARLLNFQLDEVAPGRVVFRGTPSFDHMNPVGGVHGGWYGALLDSCMACAVMTKVPKGAVYTTLEYKINITRAIPPGVEILATGWADHVGRSTGVAHGEMRGTDDGRLFATGSTTCLIMGT